MAKRPTKRTPEVEERIIAGLSDGTALRVLCREEGMPAWRTVYDWLSSDADLATRVACARDLGHEALAEDILDIADAAAEKAEAIQKAKLRIETRLKLLACWNPKKYGSKQTVDVGNKEGETLKVETNANEIATNVAAALRATKRDA